MDKHLSSISRIILDFLKENGGYGNGYSTYVKGTVSINSYSSLDWCTPKEEELTGIEVKRRGTALYKSINKYLKDNNIDNRLIIKNNHIGDGCYQTFIEFSNPYKLSLHKLYDSNSSFFHL